MRIRCSNCGTVYDDWQQYCPEPNCGKAAAWNKFKLESVGGSRTTAWNSKQQQTFVKCKLCGNYFPAYQKRCLTCGGLAPGLFESKKIEEQRMLEGRRKINSIERKIPELHIQELQEKILTFCDDDIRNNLMLFARPDAEFRYLKKFTIIRNFRTLKDLGYGINMILSGARLTNPVLCLLDLSDFKFLVFVAGTGCGRLMYKAIFYENFYRNETYKKEENDLFMAIAKYVPKGFEFEELKLNAQLERNLKTARIIEKKHLKELILAVAKKDPYFKRLENSTWLHSRFCTISKLDMNKRRYFKDKLKYLKLIHSNHSCICIGNVLVDPRFQSCHILESRKLYYMCSFPFHYPDNKLYIVTGDYWGKQYELFEYSHETNRKLLLDNHEPGQTGFSKYFFTVRKWTTLPYLLLPKIASNCSLLSLFSEKYELLKSCLDKRKNEEIKKFIICVVGDNEDYVIIWLTFDGKISFFYEAAETEEAIRDVPGKNIIDIWVSFGVLFYKTKSNSTLQQEYIVDLVRGNNQQGRQTNDLLYKLNNMGNSISDIISVPCLPGPRDNITRETCSSFILTETKQYYWIDHTLKLEEITILKNTKIIKAIPIHVNYKYVWIVYIEKFQTHSVYLCINKNLWGYEMQFIRNCFISFPVDMPRFDKDFLHPLILSEDIIKVQEYYDMLNEVINYFTLRSEKECSEYFKFISTPQGKMQNSERYRLISNIRNKQHRYILSLWDEYKFSICKTTEPYFIGRWARMAESLLAEVYGRKFEKSVLQYWANDWEKCGGSKYSFILFEPRFYD